MIKKIVCIFVLTALVATGAFAQFSLSAGGGLFFNADIQGGGVEIGIPYTGSIKEDYPHYGLGLYGFFDATFVEASAGILWGTMERRFSGDGAFKNDFTEDDTFGIDLRSIHLSLFLKYPVDLGTMSVYPKLGLEYQIVNQLKSYGYRIPDAGDFSSLWVRFGLGFDYFLSQQIFFRCSLLYGIKIPSKQDKENLDDTKAFVKSEYPGSNVNADGLLGHGLSMKAAIGFKF